MRIAVRSDLDASCPRRRALLTVVAVVLAAIGLIGAAAPTSDSALGLEGVVEDSVPTRAHADRRVHRGRRRRRRPWFPATRRPTARHHHRWPTSIEPPACAAVRSIRRRGPPPRLAA
jgi:hypothetical protein